ncbi:methylmalonyl-CoA mutase subunit beta [Flagellimonas allohymeniacidonis]|uniref:Methylmalonyl-CoA mutase n=1 Tax=Flagellimonas allohymeniacidonis TaxID=2517819 RepID=A0A4Q8QL91_9FLAO|nr:methylmalonyl-CoA mutase subunit beta [Allomuricauda hymeniacidonis]TAI49299.1 methylmalonyl-CoA mutase [Allomuricauda hymeniacidonis]
MSDNALFDEFPQVSAKQWKEKIQYDLKGADYSDTLVWESPEGIKVKPFYHSEDLSEVSKFKRSEVESWKIGQEIYAGNATKANETALNTLSRGAESLIFLIPDESIDLMKLLGNINLEKTAVHFRFQFLALAPIKGLLEFLRGKNCNIYLHFDIIGNLARTGNWFHSMKEDHEILEKVYAATKAIEGVSCLSVDLSLYQNAGANMVQQLAYSLSHAHEYVNHFQSETTSGVEESFPMTFKVAMGGNYFFEIAKLRALRWLWNSLTDAYGIAPDCHILAFPSRRNKTLYDYNVNLLRTTSECMSAILGGANTVCNQAYDAIYHKDNEFGDRIARNQLVLLKEESYFDEAHKASEGTYYIESLTKQLAEKALVLFKQIEASGGFLEALKKGIIQQKIKESAAKEQQRFDEGQTVLVGTNKFQNSEDRMKGDLELYPFVKQRSEKTLLEPIIEKRLAETQEQKRLDHE